jgi:hypothetical protein
LISVFPDDFSRGRKIHNQVKPRIKPIMSKMKLLATVFAVGLSASACGRANAGATPSDVLTVYDANGAIFRQAFSFEDGSEPAFVYLGLPDGITDPEQFGQYTTFVEADGSISDAFGIAIGGPTTQYDLGFVSDSETAGVAIDPGFYNIPEPFGPYDITHYLDPGLIAAGWRATFQSDGDIPPVPEPGSLTIFGLGLAGFVGLGWMKKRKAKAAAV